MTPTRIQRKRTKGYRTPANTVSATRPGKWGNPFKVVQEDGKWCAKEADGNYWDEIYDSKKEALDKCLRLYRMRLDADFVTGRLNLDELRGKNLSCWCKIGDPCHADYLLTLITQNT